ncbi:MAG: protein kinase domain-containing protein [Kofleriaceae bacterium]
MAAYVAGRLSRDERDRFEEHLDTCSACHELLAALGKLGASRAPVAASSLGAGSLGTAGDAASTDGDWAPGQQLGRYVLLARLGAGGMGVVYAAYDPELDRKVAVKVLRHADERAGARLRDEARAIARLAHPNVVAVHDVGVAAGEVFVAMEHVEGVTVRDWLRAPRTPSEILAVFVQAGRGLAAAHQVGLVHRDVKPSNLIVGKDGRARVLDFGLARAVPDADDGIVGTPAYMAPEQQRGDRVDARADQYAFCVALWEALAGERPDANNPDADRPDADRLTGDRRIVERAGDRVERALRRGLSPRAEDRFPTLDALLDQLAPRARTRRRVLVATFLAGGALAAAGAAIAFRDRDHDVPTCARAGEPVAQAWGDPQRAALRAAFERTRLPYAATAAATAIAQLDAWTAAWRLGAETSCKATSVDRVQPAELHAARQACLDQLLERLVPLARLTATADASLVANAGSLVAGLPSPARCSDVAGLAALPPLPPAERERAEVAALRAAMATTEAEILAGRLGAARPEVEALVRRAEALDYLPLRARGQQLLAQLEQSTSRYDESIAALHAAARAATAARDLEQLAEIWIDLTQTLGNDQRTLDQADLFDGYASALVALLPDREPLALSLAHARCNRNIARAEDAARLAAHCRDTIDRALRAQPPRDRIANAARTRLGHFQRLLGEADEARATLRTAVDEAVRVHGALHPDTAIARYALGIAEISEQRFDDGIAQLRQALEIRRASFPGNNVQVAESLQGLGDALASKGDHAEAIGLLDQAIAMLDAIGQGRGAHAANSHVLLGMSLEEVKRDDDATTHYLAAADIADRALQHREAVAAMALRLAADIAARTTRPALGVAHLERALRLLERGKAGPLELGKTQVRLAELLVELGPTERVRARATAEAARANLVTAGAPAAEQLATLDGFLRRRGWR